VVKKLYTVIISQVRDVFDMAHQDANQWSKNVLAPLVQQIKEHKKQIDSRLHMLRKISGSKEDAEENIQFLEAQLVPLVKQYTELQKIISAIKMDGYTKH
jgi:bacterioferritin (cytochrome b1)